MRLGGWEIALLVLLVIGIFGLPKLPNAARSIGRSLHILKSEVRGVDTSDEGDAPAKATGGSAPGNDKARDEV